MNAGKYIDRSVKRREKTQNKICIPYIVSRIAKNKISKITKLSEDRI